jgi:hypothetical protein
MKKARHNVAAAIEPASSFVPGPQPAPPDIRNWQTPSDQPRLSPPLDPSVVGATVDPPSPPPAAATALGFATQRKQPEHPRSYLYPGIQAGSNSHVRGCVPSRHLGAAGGAHNAFESTGPVRWKRQRL